MIQVVGFMLFNILFVAVFFSFNPMMASAINLENVNIAANLPGIGACFQTNEMLDSHSGLGCFPVIRVGGQQKVNTLCAPETENEAPRFGRHWGVVLRPSGLNGGNSIIGISNEHMFKELHKGDSIRSVSHYGDFNKEGILFSRPEWKRGVWNTPEIGVYTFCHLSGEKGNHIRESFVLPRERGFDNIIYHESVDEITTKPGLSEEIRPYLEDFAEVIPASFKLTVCTDCQDSVSVNSHNGRSRTKAGEKDNKYKDITAVQWQRVSDAGQGYRATREGDPLDIHECNIEAICIDVWVYWKAVGR